VVNVKNNLVGKKFGRLTVLEQVEDYIAPKTGKHTSRWLCECSCDNHTRKIIQGNNLTSGKINSCGCLAKEQLSKFNTETKRKMNEYDLSGEYGIGYASNTNNQFLFDIADYKIIKDYCWNEHIKSNGYHVLEGYDKESGKVIPMFHVLGCKGYDHINRNPLDNRRINLRPAKQSDNVKNKSLQKNNTSQVIGVGYMKKIGKWRARITVNEKPIYLGVYEDKTDAIKARLKAEKEYFGEFAPQKHLYKEYQIQ